MTEPRTHIAVESSKVLTLLLVGSLLFSTAPLIADEPVATETLRSVETKTLHGKVLSGYQGWFRCPEDGAGQGWRHWSRNGRRITPESLTFEMWPDMSELSESERYPAPGFTTPSGETASLFSSVNPKTVQRHFEWMRDYDLDGVFLQRFLVAVGDKSQDTVLDNVRRSATETGRAYALCYDMSGMKGEAIYDKITGDWKRLVDESRATQDDRYLHHNGRPVLFVWGFFSDRFPAELAHRLIDFFTADSPYQVTLIGGCQWYWRREQDAEWARAFRRLPIISPWNVGNTMTVGGEKHANTNYWADDLAEAKKSSSEILPVVYPGFGWTNLQGKDAAKQTIPRLRGEFYRRQFETLEKMQINMAYVAMFDEVDEATAIFKVSNTPPAEAHFETLERLPTDTYLRLTQAGTERIRKVHRMQMAK